MHAANLALLCSAENLEFLGGREVPEQSVLNF